MSLSSLTARLALAFALVVGLTGVVFSAAGYVSTERQITGQIDDFLRDRSRDIADGLRGRPTLPSADDDSRRGKRGDNGDQPGAIDDDSIVQLLDSSGRIVATTGIVLPVDKKDVELAQSRSNRTELQTIDTDEGQLRMITRAINDGGAVQVARYLEESNTVVSGLRERLIVIAIGAGLLAAGLGALMARRIAGPIKELAATVDNVAATRDFSTPIDVTGSDEVERLGTGFDNLLRSLAASQRQQNQLVQDVAHELRTPLTSIRANVDMLSMVPDMDAAGRKQTIDSVRVELQELTNLVNEIVEVAAQGGESTDARSPLDLATLATEAVERFRLRTGRAVEIEATSTTVVADRDGVLRVMANLLSNADKYSPAAQPITVLVPGDGWVHVADRGVGMAATDRERAFDRFYRSDQARSQPGSGLGLAIVASIVESHQGRVQLTDNPGGGTVASIFLPPSP